MILFQDVHTTKTYKCFFIIFIKGYSKALMLRLIINSAIQWIKTGLELKTLKVVLFSRNPTKPDKSHEPLFESFQKLKDTYGDKELTSVQVSKTLCKRLIFNKNYKLWVTFSLLLNDTLIFLICFHSLLICTEETFNPLTTKSDCHITSPYNIHTSFSKQVMRILQLIR